MCDASADNFTLIEYKKATPVLSCCGIVVTRDEPYWISRKNKLELIEYILLKLSKFDFSIMLTAAFLFQGISSSTNK